MSAILLITPLGGNLAIFYKDSGYANGLVILGKIDGDMEAFNASGSLKATIELVK
jgi:hypothetical protein